jgi:predicted HicB family RNase H-like nuclease
MSFYSSYGEQFDPTSGGFDNLEQQAFWVNRYDEGRKRVLKEGTWGFRPTLPSPSWSLGSDHFEHLHHAFRESKPHHLKRCSTNWQLPTNPSIGTLVISQQPEPSVAATSQVLKEEPGQDKVSLNTFIISVLAAFVVGGVVCCLCCMSMRRG